MTSFLAPERSRPSSVISEYYFQQFHGYPMIKRRCLFGEEYERKFCFYLSKYLEANCDDQVCLIGEDSEWINPIQERLFLNKTICFIDCNLQANIIEQRLSTNKFHRIILLNCLHKINSSSILPINLLRRSLLPNGRLIIIYREPTMSTLPLPIEVIRKWSDAHVGSSTRFIQPIYCTRSRNLEIDQKIETIQFLMNKFHWFSLLYHRMFYPLTLIHQKQMIDGMRQLNETYFKYHPDSIEMHERLIFIIVQQTTADTYFERIPKSIQSSNNLITRLKEKTLVNQFRHSQISITDEVTELLNLRKKTISKINILIK